MLCWLLVSLFHGQWLTSLADILAVFHILYVLAEGGCGHLTTNWGLLYSDFGFGSYHTGVSHAPAPQASRFPIIFPAVHPFFFKRTPRLPAFWGQSCKSFWFSEDVDTTLEPSATKKKLVPYETTLDCGAFTSGFCRRTRFLNIANLLRYPEASAAGVVVREVCK